MSRHVPTDPACRHHRPPTSRLPRWGFDRNRGRSCPVCVTPIDWPDGWAQREPVPHADRDASEVRVMHCGDPETYARGYNEGYADAHMHQLTDDDELEDAIERGRCTLAPEGWWCSLPEGHDGPCPAREEPCREVRTNVDAAALRERAERAESVARGQQRLIEAQRAEVERLRAEIDDRESERADLRDRVEKAEAAVGRVEAAAREMRAAFIHPTHPGTASMQSRHVSLETLAKWDAALRGDQ